MAKLKIDVNDLHKYYGENEVLKGISAKFYEGDVVCIIGPSGSGKSTFLRSLNLLEEVTSGTITVNGYDLTDKATNVDHVREDIGMVFQHFNLFPHMTVLQNITFAPVEHKRMSQADADKLGMELLEKVGLADKSDASPDSLSGGQKQRIAIVRSLCLNPEIMLFDEVTAALDPEIVREVLDVILNLAKDGMTMLIVTHEMSFARAVANKIVFMDAGAIVEISEPEEFFTNPKSDRAKKFLNLFSF